jgi:hypothetical protein
VEFEFFYFIFNPKAVIGGIRVEFFYFILNPKAVIGAIRIRVCSQFQFQFVVKLEFNF